MARKSVQGLIPPTIYVTDENPPALPRPRADSNRTTNANQSDNKTTNKPPERPKLAPYAKTAAATSQFQIYWSDFINRVKVHEMLRCLETEHKKLKILRDHEETEEEIEVKEREYQKLKEETVKNNLLKNAQDPTTLSPLLVVPEDRSALSFFPNIQQSMIDTDSQKYAQSAANVFKTRTDITDEEFEDILALCEDKLEQKALKDAFQEKRNREKYLHNANERRRMTYEFIHSGFFTQFMLITIIISIVGIFLLTFEEIVIHYVYPLLLLDSCIMGIFVVECILKMNIFREDYFKKPWNLLDVIIVVTHFVDVFVDLVTNTMGLSTDITTDVVFKFLKSLRALRLLRVIKFLPNLQVIVSTIFQSVLSLGSIALLMCLFMFVFSVMGTGLFNETNPKHFGNIFKTFVTLFSLLTLDDWFELLNIDPGTRKTTLIEFVIMFIYLFTYIVIEYFVFLNLFVAVLVDNFQLSLAEAEVRKQKESLDFGDTQEKFDILQEDEQNNEGSGDLTDDENEQKKEDDDGVIVITDSTTLFPKSTTITTATTTTTNKTEVKVSGPYELNAEDYFPIAKGSKEASILENALRIMTSIDFERYIWKRRLSIMNTVLDQAITSGKSKMTKEDIPDESEEAADSESAITPNSAYDVRGSSSLAQSVI